MTDHCTTDAYANTGCVGTAVQTDSTIGGLPMTGLDLVSILVLAVAVVVAGVIGRYGSRYPIGRDRYQPGGTLHVPPIGRDRKDETRFGA